MAKTLQELYTELLESDELKKQSVEAAKNGTIPEFAKANGVDTTAEEIAAFLEEKQKAYAELSADELENAAGGTCNKETVWEAGGSIVSLGIGCAIAAAASALASDYTEDERKKYNSNWVTDVTFYNGQKTSKDGRLCNMVRKPREIKK